MEESTNPWGDRQPVEKNTECFDTPTDVPTDTTPPTDTPPNDNPQNDAPPTDTPNDNPSGGNYIYNYADVGKKEPERLKILNTNEFKTRERKERKRKHLQIENNTNDMIHGKSEKDGVSKVMLGVMSILDPLFGFFGLGEADKVRSKEPEITK